MAPEAGAPFCSCVLEHVPRSRQCDRIGPWAGRGARDYSRRVSRGLAVPVPVAIFKHSQF
jgi:hypothetical protein